MEEKEGKFKIPAVRNAYYGNLKKNCMYKPFEVKKCRNCAVYDMCSENAAYIALRWYEGELMFAEADKIPERMEKAREYIEFLKEGRGEYR